MGIDLRDVNWVKIYKREAILNLDLKLKSSLIESEICSKLLIKKNKAIETISVYHQRKFGVSKGASTKVVVQALKETAKLIFVIFLFRLKNLSPSPSPPSTPLRINAGEGNNINELNQI